MIKVNYDLQTTLVKGYYPDSINYNSIPEPFIEIEDSEQDNSKQMCVINGVYQEYIKPLDIQLQETKNKKLADLSKFYDSKECWIYTLFSNLTKKYASLTRDADFFAKLLPSCGGRTIQFLDDKNKVVNYSFTVEKADNLNYKINVNNGTAIRVKKLELENKIAIANTIEIIDSIDFKTELLNAVERKINLDII